MSRPLLVGELNPHSDDPRLALYPAPVFPSGWRLAQILGMGCAEYLERFERTNLCSGFWSTEVAERRARQLARQGRPIVMLGRRVATSFGHADLSFFRVVGHGGRRFALLPHPSGLSREWNDPASVRKARMIVSKL